MAQWQVWLREVALSEILPDLADLQMVLTPALFGTEEDIRRIKQTPLYHRVMAQLEQQAARRKKE